MKKTVLGLYLTEQTTQALLLTFDGGQWTLNAAGEWHSRLFAYAGDDTPGVDEFVEQVSTFFTHQGCAVQEAAVALDTSLLFINTFPVDDPSAKKVIEEQIAWELSEYFPGSPKNAFISDYQVMVKPDSRSYTDVLAVSVRRDVVQKLRRGTSRLGLQLTAVDGDHFAAGTAVHINHPVLERKRIALVGVKHDRMDKSIVHHGETESFAYAMIATDRDIVHHVVSLAEQDESLEAVMLFGDRLDSYLVDDIRPALTIPVEVLNPFRTVLVDTPVRLKHDPTTRAFRYAAAVGVALRRK